MSRKNTDKKTFKIFEDDIAKYDLKNSATKAQRHEG
jgi:hypothetical protein